MHLGEKPWDELRSLAGMPGIRDKRLFPFLNGNKLNLISTADMDEDEFNWLHAGLGFAMRIIRHQSEDADVIIMAMNHKEMRDR